MKSGNPPQAIDLSLKNHRHYVPEGRTLESPPSVLLLKPEPRPAWSILWYRSIWPKLPLPPCRLSPPTFDITCPPPSTLFTIHDSTSCSKQPCDATRDTSRSDEPITESTKVDLESICVDLSVKKESTELDPGGDIKPTKSSTTITDVATCDGPVHFQRVSNPNFALTVEHRERTVSSSGDLPLSPLPLPNPTSKTYLCIYCNQSFKSLFCYQKHKKRHLNPVSVDIAPNPNVEVTHSLSENTLRTTDLNVQFFPCKKCGSKFPSYYFVHKHKRVCDMGAGEPEPVEQVQS